MSTGIDNEKVSTDVDDPDWRIMLCHPQKMIYLMMTVAFLGTLELRKIM